MRTRTWPGPGSGTGTSAGSSACGPPNDVRRIARIIEIWREARARSTARPFRFDELDELRRIDRVRARAHHTTLPADRAVPADRAAPSRKSPFRARGACGTAVAHS